MAEPSVQSLERAFALLELLALHPRGMALTELAETTGLHKSTVHRLLGSLFSLGYVVKDSGSGHYRLTIEGVSEHSLFHWIVVRTNHKAPLPVTGSGAFVLLLAAISVGFGTLQGAQNQLISGKVTLVPFQF